MIDPVIYIDESIVSIPKEGFMCFFKGEMELRTSEMNNGAERLLMV